MLGTEDTMTKTSPCPGVFNTVEADKYRQLNV